MTPTVETCELSEGTQLELQKIYHRREIRALEDTADYWRMMCFITWAVVAACVVLWLSDGAVPNG